MARRNQQTALSLGLLVVIVSHQFGRGWAADEEKARKAADDSKKQRSDEKLQPPTLRLARVTCNGSNEKRYSLSFELVNHNKRAVAYIGYVPESFSPPLKEPMCIYDVQYRKNGKWRQYPIGWCGFGLANNKLKSKAKKVVAVAFNEELAAGWEAIRLGVIWSPVESIDLAEQNWPKPTRVYSNPITRKNLEGASTVIERFSDGGGDSDSSSHGGGRRP